MQNVSRGTTVCADCVEGRGFLTRLIGQQFRREFGPGDGLWLAQTGSIHMFWVRFPLDLIWLDDSLTVLRVTHAIQPWRIEICRGAASVVELPAGWLQAHPTEPGDQLAFA